MIADFLTRIRNGIMVSKITVIVKKSKYIINILNVLVQDGYICGYQLREYDIIVYLKYNLGVSMILNLKLVTKPTKRVYLSFNKLKEKSKNCQICVVSTSKGIVSNKDFYLYETGLGGEVIFYIE